MNKDNQVIVVSIETLQELIADTVTAALAPLEERIIKALPEKEPLSDRLYIKDVCKLLKRTRPTIDNYRKLGILPPAQYTATGQAYWTKEQIIETLKASDQGWKYNL
jgi:hypothetical protein